MAGLQKPYTLQQDMMQSNKMQNIIETRRLYLRKIIQTDVDALVTFFSDVDAMRYIGKVKDVDGVYEWLSLVYSSYDRYGYGPWAVIKKSSNRFLGYCGLYMQKDVNGKNEVEILYGLSRENWGNGFATEAARGVYEYGSGNLNIDRFVSLIAPDNLRSIKVAEKIGMALENEIFRWGQKFCIYSVRASR